jgi:hypothetical protein
MKHDMTLSFLSDNCIPNFTLHLELRHGLNLRKRRTSVLHGGEDNVWNVMSSNIIKTQTTENIKLFSEGREIVI